MEQNLISVIIPVYKVEEYLDKCVESVINQSYKNLEIILVDDGSPDSCPKICDEWAKKDNRIKVIHKSNGGLSSARNVGLDIAKGDYIMFVDSDDHIDNNICEHLINLIKQHNCDLAMCELQLFYKNNLIKDDIEEQCIKYSNDEVINQLYNTKINHLMVACGKVFKRHIFDEIRFPINKLHEDEFTIHKILHNTKSFVTTNLKLYNYLQRENSIMSSRTEKSALHALEAFEDRFQFLSKEYPKGNKKNIEAYLNQLRGLYLSLNASLVDLKTKIFNRYKQVYLLSNSHSMKNKIFRNFKWLYTTLYRVKK